MASIAFVHSRNVMHRDISCNNVFLDKELNVKLGDFAGSAIDDETPLICYETSHEHPDNKGVSTKSEVFALGSTFYEVMTGSKPYGKLSDQAICDTYAQGNFPSLVSLAAFRGIIAKCWKQGYTSVDELLENVKAEVAAKSRCVVWIQLSVILQNTTFPIALAIIFLLPIAFWARNYKANTSCEYFVDVKSGVLQNILREVLKEVKGVSLREYNLTVNPRLLFHYLPQFKKYLLNPAKPEHASSRIQYLEMLMEFLKGHYASTIESRKALLKHDKIRFDLLWTLFPPNTIVYTESYEHNLPQCLRLDWSEEQRVQGSKVFILNCCYLGYDGKSLGDASITLGIKEFRGEEKVKSLDVFPLIYHKKAKEIRKNLIEMGQMFISLRGIHHREHNGFAFIRKEGKVDMVYIKGRVMVDTGSFKRNYSNYDILKIKTDTFGMYAFIKTPEDPNRVTKRIEADEVKEENLLTCSPTVFGFSFKSKGWGRKEIIKALIESHISERADQLFDDIVKGKGQGLIFLFHGPLGVGKILMAAGVSEFFQRPLYIVSAGDIGTSGHGLEGQLSGIFDLANHWNAILLLDEADVFLEK
ncbi:MAG: hypothetical protein M1840_001968 [Geoglossum simile]|nr:MAG: hypothetical protein M1840_001968 [Geoglossum simile]